MRAEAYRRDSMGDEPRPPNECFTRPMTAAEWEKYGPKNEKKKNMFLLKQSDIHRSLEHRGLR